VLLTIPSLDLENGGVLSGTDSFQVTGSFTWRGGLLTGPSGSSLTALGGMAVGENRGWSAGTLDGRILNNPGTATFVDGGLGLQNGAVFNNLAGATIDLQNGNGLGNVNTPGTTFSIINAGRITKSSGSGEADLAAVHNTSTGTIDVQQGSLSLNNGVTSSVAITSAPGTGLQVSGSDILTPTSTITVDSIGFGGALNLQFAGPQPGSGFDQITVASP
jgi:hypothetical protein